MREEDIAKALTQYAPRSPETPTYAEIPPGQREALTSWLSTSLLMSAERAEQKLPTLFVLRDGEVCAVRDFGEDVDLRELSHLPKEVRFLGDLTLEGDSWTTLPQNSVEGVLDISRSSIELSGDETADIETLLVNKHQEPAARRLSERGMVRTIVVDHSHQEIPEL